jgi:hypothetical protein
LTTNAWPSARCSTTGRLRSGRIEILSGWKWQVGSSAIRSMPGANNQAPGFPWRARSRSLFFRPSRLVVASRRERQFALADAAQMGMRVGQARKYCCTVEVDSPRARRRASQRIRGFADERNTPINYNNRLGARLAVGRGVKIAIARR